MPKVRFESVADYLAAQPPEGRRALERIRAAVLNAVPQAQETISYNMPTVILHGKTLLHFAVWKDFCSVYPANSRLLEALGNELKRFLTEKSTLRFPLSEPLPLELIERVATFRAEEISSRN